MSFSDNAERGEAAVDEPTAPVAEETTGGSAVQDPAGGREAAAEAGESDPPQPVARASRRRRRITAAAVTGAVVMLAAVGMLVWHEQPSFCNAICHSPMDPYLPTYEAADDGSAVDKWGNAVDDPSGMLASVHATAGKTCMDCHVPSLNEQVTEGLEWITGAYADPLGERTLDQLVEARGLENSEEFCMNDTCHSFSRDDLVKKTAWMGEVNPHLSQHGEQDCGLCHKAHRSSVMYCSQCHSDAVVPDGWVTYEESERLLEQSGTLAE